MFWPNLYLARLCSIYLSLIAKLLWLVRAFLERLTRFVLPSVVKRFLHAEAKIESDLMCSRGVMNQFNIELDWNFTHSLTLSLMCSKPYRGQVSDKSYADLFSQTFIQ